MKSHFSDVVVNNKIAEVISLIETKSLNTVSEEQLNLLKRNVISWIQHPIFSKTESLPASAIFAQGFGKILCTNNLKFIASRLEEIRERQEVIDECTNIAVTVREKFNALGEDMAWNAQIHERLLKVLGYLEDKIAQNTEHKNILFICKKLLDQVIEEICTDTITKINGYEHLYRSHYFDFVEWLKKSSADLYLLYASNKELEQAYLDNMDALFQEWGKDAVIAITLISEAFIALTYVVILADVVNDMDTKNKDKELANFYRGHIMLDGVEHVNSKNTHFEMIQHMLDTVDNWDNFMQYCIKFMDTRKIVHDALVKAK